MVHWRAVAPKTNKQLKEYQALNREVYLKQILIKCAFLLQSSSNL